MGVEWADPHGDDRDVCTAVRATHWLCSLEFTSLTLLSVSFQYIMGACVHCYLFILLSLSLSLSLSATVEPDRQQYRADRYSLGAVCSLQRPHPGLHHVHVGPPSQVQVSPPPPLPIASSGIPSPFPSLSLNYKPKMLKLPHRPGVVKSVSLAHHNFLFTSITSLSFSASSLPLSSQGESGWTRQFPPLRSRRGLPRGRCLPRRGAPRESQVHDGEHPLGPPTLEPVDHIRHAREDAPEGRTALLPGGGRGQVT